MLIQKLDVRLLVTKCIKYVKMRSNSYFEKTFRPNWKLVDRLRRTLTSENMVTCPAYSCFSSIFPGKWVPVLRTLATKYLKTNIQMFLPEIAFWNLPLRKICNYAYASEWRTVWHILYTFVHFLTFACGVAFFRFPSLVVLESPFLLSKRIS